MRFTTAMSRAHLPLCVPPLPFLDQARVRVCRSYCGSLREARGALWTEIDFDAAMWLVPPERMKARVAHRVPLSSRTLVVLEGARAAFPDHEVAGHRCCSQEESHGVSRFIRAFARFS